MYFFKPADSPWNRYVIFPVKYTDSDSRFLEIWRKIYCIHSVWNCTDFRIFQLVCSKGRSNNRSDSGAVFGGALIAVGMGIAFKCRATTGGMDIIVKVIKLKFPYLKTGTIFLLADAIVIGFGGIVFGNLNAILYSVLAEVVTSKVLDLILYGTDGAKLLYIISDHSERIAERILIEIDSGVTYLEGKGAYQNTDKKVILCVIRKQNMQKMEDIVRMEDENAFMIVSSASEIYGEGYKSYFMEKL